MFKTLAKVVNRRGWIFVLAWVVGIGLLWKVAPTWESVSKDDDVSFFPAGYPSVLGQELLRRGFPGDLASSQAVFVAERPDGQLQPADLDFMAGLADSINTLSDQKANLGIKSVVDHRAAGIGERLKGTSRDGKGQATLVIVALKGTYVAKSTRIAVDTLIEHLAKYPKPPEGLKIGLSGSAAVGHDMNTATNTSGHNTTRATIILVIAILLIVYRSPLLALMPMAVIAVSVFGSLKAIATLTLVPGISFQVINITNIFVIVVLFGAGTDYCLFLIARYREELIKGRNNRDAIREAIEQTGGALVASAGTVIIGLGMLWFSSFAKIQYTGPAIALSLVFGLLASLTLAPVLLNWLGKWVFWPFKPPHHEKGKDREQEALEQLPLAGFWSKVADVVVARPASILLLSLVVLIPFAWVGAGTRSNFSQLSDLSPDQPSVVGSRIIERYFSPGELGPAGLLISHRGLDFTTDAGRNAVEELSKALAKIDNIAEVRSISRPLGKAPAIDFAAAFAERLQRAVATPRYVSIHPESKADLNRITRLDIVFKTDPFSDASLATLTSIQAALDGFVAAGKPFQGAELTGFVGSTVMVSDLQKVIGIDERTMYIYVTTGVYVILVLLIRRPLICLYLIVTVVLGYLASLGMTELLFKALHHGPTPWTGLDWKVGFFLYVILVAVGEDYNIFLMTRVIEEEEKFGLIEGTRHAVAHTGGIISSCGLIMAGTFFSMLTASLTALRELGFALGLGVMLDTFIVRPILVPAFVVLVGRLQEKRKGKAGAALSEPQATSAS